MLDTIEVSIECSLIGIFEWDYEVVTEWSLLGLKYNINEGDKLRFAVACSEYVSDLIRTDSFKWNYEGILLGISNDANLAYPTIKCLVLLIIPNLGNNLVVRKVHYLVYLSEMIQASLESTWLELMYKNTNRLQSTYLN